MSGLSVLNNSLQQKWVALNTGYPPRNMKPHKTYLHILYISALTFCLTLPGQAATANQTSAVALMYHHFGDSRYPSTNIQLEQFEQHLQFLEQQGFHVLPLNTVLKALQQNEALPDKSVVITMDDAYLSVYTEAYPRLKLRGWPFTVFVSTDYIDKQFSNYMNWEQMREMQQHGASVGNHSRSHHYLIRRNERETHAEWQQRIRDDINTAQQRLREELTNVVDVIAYPYGEYNLALAQIVQSLGLIGMGQHSGAIGTASDFRFLPRFPMNENFGEMDGFKSKVMSLAMPLQKTPEVDPETDATQPQLTIEIDQDHTPLKQLSCYASGQGRIEVQWLNEYTFTVQANSPLPAGRSRYNCTAPSTQAGRFYWFSQPWIRPGGIETEH